jgi:hypothetical protein
MTVIRFKIGDAFPASDPVARFLTGLAMISNDSLCSVEDMFKLKGDMPEEIGRRISLFRRQEALVHEAATFITDARRMFPQVASFINGLEVKARDGCRQRLAALPGRMAGGPPQRHPITTRRCTRRPRSTVRREMASAG